MATTYVVHQELGKNFEKPNRSTAYKGQKISKKKYVVLDSSKK